LEWIGMAGSGRSAGDFWILGFMGGGLFFLFFYPDLPRFSRS
jgi:hypothetical protein